VNCAAEKSRYHGGLSRKIDFFFFDAGGGHRAAATALKSVIERTRRPWEIRLVNIQELFDEIDWCRKLTGCRVQDAYNLLLRKGWTLGMDWMRAGLRAAVRYFHPRQVAILEAFWNAGAPDLAVSLIPNFNRALFEALRRANPAAPFVTILTDLADIPPNFWIERQPQYLICGTDRAVEQARQLGHPPERIYRVSGMILRPQFFEQQSLDRAAERRRLGLEPDVPTGLVLFGGEGSPSMLEIARRLEAVGHKLQLIFICGRNEELARRLRAAPRPYRFWVEGFTAEIPRFMRLADFFIGKPGPGSISEALEMDLPVIVEQNAWTMPQERYNADWIREQHLGLVVRSFRQVAEAVEELLAPGNLEAYQARARRVHNRAVFEIPDILEEILRRGPLQPVRDQNSSFSPN
jgi:hypothetical protein